MSWTLHCKWCHYYIVVADRGGRGGDQGSGVEAANLMQDHIVVTHGKTWAEFRKPEVAHPYPDGLVR